MNDIRPINYQIRLEPDLERFRFTGQTRIVLEASQPVGEIELNALDLAFWACEVQIGKALVACPFLVDRKKEILRIALPGKMGGRIEMDIAYEGRIGEGMKGFYRSKYTTGGTVKYLAVTQFEESDARRAFPCFDHPRKKATFDIELTVDGNLTAISNRQIVEQISLDDGRKRFRFQQTPRMSTYLLFFAVGEFEFLEDPGKVLVRVATTPGMSQYARFGLEFGRKALEFCETYYDIEYPLQKLDLIAVADFAAGAMENWGAMTFRENLLLHYPNMTSKAGEGRICEVIAHETAHQWFGNLVSPSDWKYLWLNESFATYFGYGVVDAYYPEWDVWSHFLHSQTATALERDALHETFSIEIPGGEHVVINAGTAPIIYNKGGSILRQVEGYIGSEPFKQGLRRYLKKHAYGCAASHHLWEALDEGSETPVTAMMRSWIEQPGYPLLEATRDGERLVLSQKRFTFLPDESAQKWLIPIRIKIFYETGSPKTVRILLDAEQTVVNLGKKATAYKVNDEQTGFYRVRYRDEDSLHALGEHVLSKALPPPDRWGLQNDLYAFVKGGLVSLDAYLDFLSAYYADEDAFLPVTSIAANLFHAYLVMDGVRSEKTASIGKTFFDGVLSRVGFEPHPGEGHATSLLRDQIMFQAVLFGSEATEAFATEKFSLLMGGGAVHPDIMTSVMQSGALHGGEDVFNWFKRRLETTESEQERMIILTALGSFRDGAVIEKVRQYALDEVPQRNKFIPISCLGINLHAMPHMWQWYLQHVDVLEKFHPIHYERVIQAIVPFCCMEKEEEARQFFDAYMRRSDRARDVIKLSLEKLRIHGRMRVEA